MGQSNIIAGVLLLAFFVYITTKGELETYLGFFIPSASAPTQVSPVAAAVSNAAAVANTPAIASAPAIEGGLTPTEELGFAP